MFRIKICGITNVPDAITAVDAGADAIGLNFYEKSRRFVADEASLAIFQAVHSHIRQNDKSRDLVPCIGVFVNKPIDDIKTIQKAHHLCGIQLHGDESPDYVAQFAETEDILPAYHWRVILARRLGGAGMEGLAANLESCNRAGRRPDAVLVDSDRSGQFGGTGETLPWNELADHRRWLGDTPLILAGGLTPDNVAEAIRIVRPHGVDVASGVESAPGKKDPAKVRDFIAAARSAFDAL
jgi:phosphoribosylanthranilate isomerase